SRRGGFVQHSNPVFLAGREREDHEDLGTLRPTLRLACKGNWGDSMKATNRLLLGTAAGLMAASGAQAADMPLKAKPVQYVKICTLYGDGYYYIPGTDTCIKIGGIVQLDVGWNAAGARVPAYSGTQGAQDRTVSQMSSRARGNVAMD